MRFIDVISTNEFTDRSKILFYKSMRKNKQPCVGEIKAEKIMNKIYLA